MTESLSPEQKLAAIIEAQVKGRYTKWGWLFDASGKPTFHSGPLIRSERVLDVLFDPKGLKAAYREKTITRTMDCGGGRKKTYVARYAGDWHKVSHNILDAWLTGGAEAAIDTAYALLPKP